MVSKPSRSVVICRFSGNDDPYPAADPRGFRFVMRYAACMKSMSSVSDSAYAPNHSPKLDGIATCRCVYPGMSMSLYSSDLAMSSSNSERVSSVTSFSCARVKSFRSSSTWSLRERPE